MTNKTKAEKVVDKIHKLLLEVRDIRNAFHGTDPVARITVMRERRVAFEFNVARGMETNGFECRCAEVGFVLINARFEILEDASFKKVILRADWPKLRLELGPNTVNRVLDLDVIVNWL